MTTNFRKLKSQEEIFNKFIRRLSPQAQTTLKAAFKLSKHAHTGQKRDEGDPYFIHPLRVANFLIKDLKVFNPDIISSALLHDVVEDTDVPLSIIKKQFGTRIGNLVKNLTRPRPKHETEDHKRKGKLKKYYALLKADEDTRLIKCADMLDNLRSMHFVPKHHPTRRKFPRWLEEVKKYNLPLARITNKTVVIKMQKTFNQTKKYLSTKTTHT
ncbi:MAG: HD domain-containing protein [Candidatus Magasanikbacteria bacterium]